MPSKLTPYLNFDGNAREAMEFYAEVLGGTLEITTFAAFGETEQPVADQVMHAVLDTPAGFTLMASDTPPGMEAPSGGAMSISLFGDDEDELRGYWDGLADGGLVTMPLEPQMWGDTFGMLVDRFGIPWMVNIAGVPA